MSMNLKARAEAYRKQKSLGQCFLVDESILNQIIESANLNPQSDTVLEIGPGIGFLTEYLAPQVKALYAVELDTSTLPFLQKIQGKFPNFVFKRADFLGTKPEDLMDEEQLNTFREGRKPKIKIIANIPYQISSKILVHLLGEIGEPSAFRDYISDIFIMVQKEYALRLLAKPGTKDYGSITLLVQYWADLEYLFDVPRTCFSPSPNVDSAFIRISPLPKPRIISKHPLKLRKLIRAIFANRRKTLSNALKIAGYNKEVVDSLKLEKLRGETLPLQEIDEIVEKLNNAGST